VARGEKVAPAKIRFGEVAEEWFDSKRKLRAWTRKGYRDALDRILLPRFQHMKVAAITAEHVATLIRELEAQGLAASTIANYLKPLNGALTFAVRRGHLSVNPCALLTSDERPGRGEQYEDHIWSDEEIAALVEAAEYLAGQPASRYDYSPIIRTALYTGLRLGELLGLQWLDIDLSDGALYVRRQYTRAGELAPPKTPKANRRVPLSQEMVKYLTAYKLRARFSTDSDPVFGSRNGGHLSHRNVTRRGFEPARDREGARASRSTRCDTPSPQG
jgi:integrase